MSSSEVRRVELPDLGAELPAPRGPSFVEAHTFEKIDREVVREASAEEAHRAGFAEGEAAGLTAAQKELVPVLDELRALGRALGAARSERLVQVESELVDLANEITRRVLRGEMSQDGDTVLRMAHTCIDAARERDGQMTLRVAPGDLELVRTHLPELQLDLVEASIEIAADATLAAGNVVLETPEHCYEGRPERMLDAARADVTHKEDEA